MSDAATVTDISKAKTRRKAVDEVVQLALTEHHNPKDLVPNPDNIRHDLGDLAELTESIRVHGVIQPLVASRDSSGQLVLIAGHRRRAAAVAAKLDTVPVVVRAEPNRAELFELMLAENNHRNDLDPIDEALAVAAIKAAGRKTIKDIAAAVNRSSTWVSTRLALAKLPEPVHELVRNGNLGVDDATAIAGAKLPDGEMERLAQLSGHQLRQQLNDAAVKAKHDSWVEKATKAWPGRKIVDDVVAASRLATFAAVGYGPAEGQLLLIPEMDIADDQVIVIDRWNGGKVTVFNIRPESCDPGDFVPISRTPSDEETVGLEIFHDDDLIPTPIGRLHKVPKFLWQAAQDHQACSGHRLLDAPWSHRPVAVCVTPWVHEPDKGPTWEQLAEASAETAAAEHAPAAPRPRRDWRDTLGPELTREMVATVMTAVSTIDPAFLVALTYCDLSDVDPDNYPEAIANEIGEQFDVVCRSVEETGTNLNDSDQRMITWLRTIAQRVDAPLPVALLELEPEEAAE